MTATKLNVSVEELAAWLCSRNADTRRNLDIGNARIQARKMLAADALYEAANKILEVADATDCDQPMTEQFVRKVGQHGERFRLNNLLSDAQDTIRQALALADGKDSQADTNHVLDVIERDFR